MTEKYGPAWFKHRQHDGSMLRIFIRGFFTPIHGRVIDTDRNRVCIQVVNHLPKWIFVAGKKNQVTSVEVIS